jgi:predicted N-formylglutamate amidohydrolase
MLLHIGQDELVVDDNKPYRARRHSAYAERRGLHHIAIEIHQDLIAGDAGQRAWRTLLAQSLSVAYQEPPANWRIGT